MKLLIASNNAHKIKEIKAILGNYFEEIQGLKEAGYNLDVEETGKTFYENARLKAATACQHTGLACLADDSGIIAEALNEPGVYSARYAGEPCDDEKNNDKLLERLKNQSNRRAKFVSSVVVVFPDGREIAGTGETLGEVLPQRMGSNGFGYDCLFYSYELQKSFGLASDAEKNSVSHRYKALMAVQAQMKAWQEAEKKGQ